MDSERPAPYHKISQTQRQILEKFYNGKEGHAPMQSTRGANMKSAIQEAARETGLSKEKIEVRILFLHILELSMALPGPNAPLKHLVHLHHAKTSCSSRKRPIKCELL